MRISIRRSTTRRSLMAAAVLALSVSHCLVRSHCLALSSLTNAGRRCRLRPMTTVLKQSLLRDEDTNGLSKTIHPSLVPIHEFTSQITEIHVPKNKRVIAYCISDLHADGISENWNWMKEYCIPTVVDKNVYNILIIPGDLANSISSLKRSFKFLSKQWDAVCYVVGNHEAWVNENNEEDNEDEDMYAINFRTSVDQLVDVYKEAKKAGIHVGPVCVNHYDDSDNDNSSNQKLWMVPLQSFYHSSWDNEPELDDPALLAAEERRPFRRRWQDFRNMKWPTDLTSHQEFTEGDDGRGGSLALASAFGDLNESLLENWEASSTEATTVISFSHYVPRVELSIEKRYLVHPSLARVVGSNRLEKDVRRLKPDLHLFGHTHIPIGMECDGLRYAQWPLGYPRESALQCRIVANQGPMVVFDSHFGVPETLDAETSRWSQHYYENNRDPTNLELAPWVRDRLERVGRKK